MKKIVSLFLISAMASAMLLMSGCESNNQQQASQEPSKLETESSRTLTDSELDAMQATINSFKNEPEFSANGENIKSKTIAKDKKLGVVLDDSNDSYSSYVSESVKKAAKTAGFKDTVIYETDGSTGSQTNALESVVEDGCSAVLLFGNIDKDSLSATIETTQANGIKVVSAGNAAKEQKEHFVDSAMTVDYEQQARLMVDWASLQKQGKINALAVFSDSLPYSENMKKAVEEEFEKYVVSGYLTVIDGARSSWGSGLTDSIKNELEKDSNINCIILIHDGMIKDAVNALEITQSMSKVSLVARGGSADAFNQVKNGNVDMLVSESYDKTAYSAVDYILRVLDGNDSPSGVDVPFKIITVDNVQEVYGDGDGSDNEKAFIELAFDTKHRDEFKQLWGV